MFRSKFKKNFYGSRKGNRSSRSLAKISREQKRPFTHYKKQIAVSQHPLPPAALVHKHSLDFFFKFETCKSGLHMGDSADTFEYQRLSQKPVILKVCPQPTMSALPRNFEMSHPRRAKSENLGMGSNSLFFFQLLLVMLIHTLV